jgi:rhomboid protease GluP
MATGAMVAATRITTTPEEGSGDDRPGQLPLQATNPAPSAKGVPPRLGRVATRQGGMGGAPMENEDGAWVEVARLGGRAEAEQQALVLAAVGIRSLVIGRGAAPIRLLVASEDSLRAEYELDQFRRENRRPARASPPLPPLAAGADGVLVYAALLAVLFQASGRRWWSQDWWAAGTAQAGLIMQGEWWRTVTALGLHADLGHFGSNLAFGALFGLLLAQLLGQGLAWLAILAAGALGNGLTAFLRPEVHASIGASTAVFAALGLLSAVNWRREAPRFRGLRRWLPLAAGVMLVAWIGVGGERTDVLAHIAGFTTGVVLGTALALAHHLVPQDRIAQRLYGGLALGVILLAWAMALRAHS